MKIAMRYLGFVALMLLTIQQHCNAQLSIEFTQAEINVSASTVRLADIAKITSPQQGVVESAREIDIDTFEGTKTELRVTKEQVRIRMILAGFRASELNLSGPDKIQVVRVNARDPRPSLESALTQELSAHFSIPADDLHVRLDASFKQNGREYNWSTLRMEPLESPELPLGRQTFPVQVSTRFDETRSVEIPAVVAVYRDLAVAKTDIPRGTRLSESNIESVRRPVATRAIGYTSIGNAMGKEAQTDIEQYSLIKPTSLRQQAKPVSLVRRNSFVRVVIRSGSLVAQIPNAKVLTDGNPGDQVQVINPFNQERMVARVVDGFTVEIR